MSFDTRVSDSSWQSFCRKYGVDNSSVLSYSVSVFSSLLVVECLLFVAVPAVESYETSLVEAFPLSFWLLFYTVMLGGVGVLIGSAMTNRAYWPHGLGLILSNYALFLFLPATRGYALYGRGTGDVLHHLGNVQVIVGSGSLPSTWYPGTHVLMAEMNMLGVPFGSLQYVFAFLFTALHIVGIGVLVRKLSGRQEGLSLGMAAAVPLVYIEMHIATRPAMYSFALLPIVAVVFERYRTDREFANVWVLMLLGLFMVYTHPMTTILMSVLLTVAAVYSAVHSRLIDSSVSVVSPRLAVVFPMLLFMWIRNFGRFRNAISTATSDGSAPGAVEVQEATELSFTLLELAQRFIQLYGTITLYGATAGIVSLFLCHRLRSGSGQHEWGFSTAQFGVGLSIAFVFVVAGLIVGSVIRSSRYALLFAVVLIALGMVQRLLAGDKWTIAALVLVIFATAVIGVNATYEPNKHLTYSEYDGTEYLLTNNPEQDIYSADTSHKMAEYVLGTGDSRLYPEQMPRENQVPRELGYDSDGQTAGDTFGNVMVVTKAYDMEQHTASYYTDEQQEFLRIYGSESVERLGADPTANRVYSNGGFEGWDVRPDEDVDG